jgi:hypothetical protein
VAATFHVAGFDDKKKDEEEGLHASFDFIVKL